MHWMSARSAGAGGLPGQPGAEDSPLVLQGPPSLDTEVRSKQTCSQRLGGPAWDPLPLPLWSVSHTAGLLLVQRETCNSGTGSEPVLTERGLFLCHRCQYSAMWSCQWSCHRGSFPMQAPQARPQAFFCRGRAWKPHLASVKLLPPICPRSARGAGLGAVAPYPAPEAGRL